MIPSVIICFDEFGPLNLVPHPGRQWAGVTPWRRCGRPSSKTAPAGDVYRSQGVRHLLAAYDLSADKLYGHVKPKKGRTEFLAFLRYLRSLHPARGAHRRSCWTTSVPHRSGRTAITE